MVHQRKTKVRKNGLYQNITPNPPLQNLNGISHKKKNFKNNKNKNTTFFPKISPWIISLIVLLIRLNYVSKPRNWWILHPDEIFQSLEVAHSEVYGYGIRPYEYLPPLLEEEPKGRKHELRFGMFSLRSFLFPKIFILVSKLSRIFVDDTFHPFILWKMSHAAVTSLLPIAVYRFTMTICRSHDSGVLSCILTSFSVHLSVFATHTIISSFLAPFVFFTLPPLWGIFQPDYEIPDDGHDYNMQPEQEAIKINNNLTVNCDNKTPRFNLFSTKNDLQKERMANSTLKRPKQRLSYLFICGSFIGIFIYIRIDLSVFYLSVFLPLMLFNSSMIACSVRKLIFIFLGICLGVLIGAIDDYYSYNSFFISPYQWFMFNVFKDYSTTFFGRCDTGFYISNVLLHNFSMVLMLSLTCLVVPISIVRPNIACNFRTKQTLCLLLSTTIIFTSYSLKGHKEARFSHNAIVLLMVIHSSTLLTIYRFLYTRFEDKTSATKYFPIVMLILYTGHQWYVFPDSNSFDDWNYVSSHQSGNANECLYYISQQRDVSGVFLDQSLYTSGAYSLLHLDVPLFTLIQNEFYEFRHETKLRIRRLREWFTDTHTSDDKIAVYAFCNVSDYITIYNIHHLLKRLLIQRDYNYVIIKKSRQFLRVGFKEVFKSGSMRVLKRIGDLVSEKNIDVIVERISPFDSFNSGEAAQDVLLHETHFLYSYGQYKLAEERLSVAAHLNSPRIEVFQLLFNIYKELKDQKNAEIFWRRCVTSYSRELCLQTVHVGQIKKLSKKWSKIKKVKKQKTKK